jgi:hypothetical protein
LKPFHWTTLLFAVALSLPLVAQQKPNLVIEKDTRVAGELATAIDINKANPGDKVVVKIVGKFAMNGKIYDSGKVLGFITKVQAPTQDSPQSRLVIVLDRIKVKGRDEEPIAAVMGYIARPAPPVITRVSGVPSDGDPMARAAGPMVDNYGRPVTPLPSPRMESLPTKSKKTPDLDNLDVEPNYDTHETVITAKTDFRLLKESRVNLILNEADNHSK